MANVIKNDLFNHNANGDGSFQVVVYDGPYTDAIKKVLNQYRGEEPTLPLEYGYNPKTHGPDRSQVVRPSKMCGFLSQLMIDDVHDSMVRVVGTFRPVGAGAGETIHKAFEDPTVGGTIGFKARHPRTNIPVGLGVSTLPDESVIVTFDVVFFQPIEYSTGEDCVELPKGDIKNVTSMDEIKILASATNLFQNTARVEALYRDVRGFCRRLPLKVVIPDSTKPEDSSATLTLIVDEVDRNPAFLTQRSLSEREALDEEEGESHLVPMGRFRDHSPGFKKDEWPR